MESNRTFNLSRVLLDEGPNRVNGQWNHLHEGKELKFLCFLSLEVARGVDTCKRIAQSTARENQTALANESRSRGTGKSVLAFRMSVP